MSASAQMSDTAKIDYINKIDFSKGFQRFHIKWPLKDLTKPKCSSIFETTVIDGSRKVTLSWALGIDDSTANPTDTWFGAHVTTAGKITPGIYRICLSSSTNVLFDSSYFLVFDGPLGYGKVIPSSEVNVYPIDDLMLQFWMDIPIAICIGNNSDKIGGSQGPEYLLQRANNDDGSTMFNRVMRADYDPLSDVSLIIVNSRGEEVRRFRCHKVFLSARSDVLKRMFESKEWEENAVKDGSSVRINDISAHVMETVLKYIYTLALPDPSIDQEHLCGIIYAADKYKYNLKELTDWCVGVLIVKLDAIESRIEQLILADRQSLAQLKAVCIDQLSFGFSTSFSDNAKFKDIPVYLWLEIMKVVSDRLMKTTEIVLPAA